MRSALSIFVVLILSLSCGSVPEASSRLAASREARAVLGPPQEIPPSLFTSIKAESFRLDLPYQRKVLWEIWSFLFTEYRTDAGPSLDHWQSWYAADDLGRIFRHLYEKLGRAGRKERQPFSEALLDEALLWHDRQQFKETAWDEARWSHWLASHEDEAQRRALPGMNKILMNREALLYILRSYASIAQCYREPELCAPPPPLPIGSAFLKTAWRRSGDGFSVPLYGTHELSAQFAAPQWMAFENSLPGPADAYTIKTLSGQIFHLVGMHLMLKWRDDQEWLWSSLWLGGPAEQDLAADQPLRFRFPRYRLCSLGSFKEDWRKSVSEGWSQEIQHLLSELSSAGLPNWCSNPYLELGAGNQKTNCVGCHQHAGRLWNNQEFNRRLTLDLPSLLEESLSPGPIDRVWSLTTGPSAFAATLVDTIDYFDVYDPYN